MKRIVISGLIVFSAAALFIASFATSPAAKQAKKRGGPHQVSLPAHAVEVVPGKVYWLGTAMEKGRLVEGYAIIQRKKDFAKPSGCNDDGVCQGWEAATCGDCGGGGEPPVEESTCYGFLAKGAKWKTAEDYIVDENATTLDPYFVSYNLDLDIDKWEEAANAAYDIMRQGVVGVVNGADTIVTDGKNEVMFGDITEPGAIAITIVWGVFRGAPQNRELVEWDQVYDDVDFIWSEDCEFVDSCTDKMMDFENIATHEMGHSFGLDDLYTDDCSLETMYGFASGGETDKRDLEAGDITGIRTLYQ